jgi:hypothetical protein
MKHRASRGSRHHHDDLNRGDYRGDFGPEGHDRFASPPDHDHREHHEGHYGRRRYRDDRDASVDRDHPRREHEAGPWRWERFGREGWQRQRASGGYGSQYEAWRSGAGFTPAGFGFGPGEEPRRGGVADEDWQPTRPARGRGAWAADWEDRDERVDHRGRGPKGYRRSDDRIREEVCERLTDDGSVDATNISVQVQDGEVTLTGAVPSRAQKRNASMCVENVSGVHDVFNQLRVEHAGSPTQRAGVR